MDIGQGLASFGSSMAGMMGQYHKEHQAYDEQAQLAEALSRLGINEQGQITTIDPNSKDKSIQPIIDPKALQTFQTKNHEGQVKATGALEALNKMAVHGLAPIIGQMGQENLRAQQLANQRYNVQVGDQTYPATAGQAIQSGMEQQRVDIAKQPKGMTAYQQFQVQQKQATQTKKDQESLPEFQFQKKYQVMPKDILNQPMAYDTQYADPDKLNPNQRKNVVGYTPTTPVYRERQFKTNQNGVKQEGFAPDPEGDIVNFKGQRIPFSDYQTLLNRQQFVYDRAKAALQRGTPPDEVVKRLEAMGFDPAGVK